MSASPPPAAGSRPARPPASLPSGEADLKKLFEVWADSELKAQVIVFYNNNPGVIETAEGLARRLGLSPEPLREALADHVRLGMLVERRLGDKTVFLFNRDRRLVIQEMIMKNLQARMEASQ